MNAVTDLVVPRDILEQLNLSPDEMLIELATHLYKERKLSMGRAKRLAKLDQIAFQHELAKRDICMNYDVEEFRKDLATLGILERKRNDHRSK